MNQGDGILRDIHQYKSAAASTTAARAAPAWGRDRGHAGDVRVDGVITDRKRLSQPQRAERVSSRTACSQWRRLIGGSSPSLPPPQLTPHLPHLPQGHQTLGGGPPPRGENKPTLAGKRPGPPGCLCRPHPHPPRNS